MNEPNQDDSILDRICIAMPCSMDWNDMKGNDEVRLCGGCNKNVYNISAMSKNQAEELLNSPTLPCLQIQRLENGAVVTDECPELLRPIRSYLKSTTGFLLSLVALLAPQLAAAADEKFIPRPKGRPALVNDANREKPKVPLSKVLHESKAMGTLGSPCVRAVQPKEGTVPWRENLTSSAWPHMINELGFKTEDIPPLYKDQLKQLATIAPDSITIEPVVKSDQLSPLHTDSWNEVELARESHMRACMYFLRNDILQCLAECDSSSAHYLKALNALRSLPSYDEAFERFITVEKSKVLLIRVEAKKLLVETYEVKLSPNDPNDSK